VWDPKDPIQSATAKERAEKAREQMALYEFTPADNFKLFMETIQGNGPQWVTDLICINAAAGFVANCCSSIDASYDMALDLIRNGKVAEKFEECKKAYAKLSTR
jgi:anthranilate phosphoribosyltransferase